MTRKEVKSKEDWDRHLQWLLERPARRAAAVKASEAVKVIAAAEASGQIVSRDEDFVPVVEAPVENAPVAVLVTSGKKAAQRIPVAFGTLVHAHSGSWTRSSIV